jgi:bacillolysin
MNPILLMIQAMINQKRLMFLVLMSGLTMTALGQTANPNPFLRKQKNKVAEPTNLPIVDGRSQQQSKTTIQSFKLNKKLSTFFVKPQSSDSFKTTFTAQGLPVLIEDISVPQTSSANLRVDATASSFQYLAKVKGLMQIERPEEEFSVVSSKTDELGMTHVRMQQRHKGIKVWGGQVVLHGKYNHINLVNGRHFPTPQVKEVTPTILESQASQIAETDAKTKSTFNHLKSFLGKPLPDQETVSELIIYHEANELQNEKLCWHVTVKPNLLERWEYFVDAKDGKILEKYISHCSIDGPRVATATDLNAQSRSINSYQVGSNYYMIDATRLMYSTSRSALPDSPVGAIWTIDAGNKHPSNSNFGVRQIASTNNTWNPTAVSAHYNAGLAYEYFRMVHARNSIDNEGVTVTSIINVSEQDGTGLDNAFWNGQYMFYGNGNTSFKPLAGSLDVAGHEITHGVVQNSANLEYKGQSGAINESMADIFGSLIDRSNFLIGETIVKLSAFPSGAMRSLQDPNQGGTSLNSPGFQPKNMSQYYSGSEDNGGVHINSGIVNYAYYLFVTTAGMNKEKAEKIYYRALTEYLTSKSQFIDLRLALIKSAEDLFSAAEANALKAAFDAVGITDGAGNNTSASGTLPYSLPTNPGTEFMLSYNLETTGGGLQVSSISGANVSLKTSTKPKTKPSITDDGSVAVFVAQDEKIHVISLTGAVNEQIINSPIKWNSVAVSKDGSKLAATTSAQDTSIYIISLDQSKVVKYRLYNPTNVQGVKTGGVVYADALDWDHTGEYVIYDAFNKIVNADGGTLENWDIGFIKVWDNSKDDFGSGEIAKLFSGLSESESVGNPVFSKNSPFVIAFDYFDSNTGIVSVFVWNYEITKGSSVMNQNDFGFPSFSKADNKLIFSGVDNAGTPLVASVDLNADKISTSATNVGILTNTKWGVGFSQGSRTILPMSIGALDDIICKGSAISIPYQANYAYNQGNRFTAQLSDETGNFANAVSIGSVTNIASGTIPATIPTTTKRGGGYRIRIISSSPVLYGLNNGVDLSTCDFVTGLENPTDGVVTIYPNPATERVKLKFPFIVKKGTVVLLNTLSSKLLEAKIENNQEIEINLTGLSHGIYILQLQLDDTYVARKIIVE